MAQIDIPNTPEKILFGVGIIFAIILIVSIGYALYQIFINR
jgi:hypothetical protein